MAQTMFTGSLNTNELYTAIYNMIISQRLFDIKVAEPTLANKLKVDGTLYGDTKLYYSMDIGGSYVWGNDAEAPNLLAINRNKTQKCQKVTLDKFRQANITIDNYLSKRAWKDEGVFGQFNGILIASIGQTKKVFENGYVNTFVGTNVSTASACNITVDRSDLTVPTTAVEAEAVARISGQRMSKAIADLFVKLKDNTRDYNEYGYLRAYDPNELLVVWNAEVKNQITKLDLPMVYNNGNLQPIEGISMPSRYFGTLIDTAGTVATANTVRSAVEREFFKTDGTTSVGYIRQGEYVPKDATYLANEVYTPDSSIACKIISTEGLPFMSSMEVGTVFYNSRSLTENHYLTWGFNTLQSLKEKPFITIKQGALTPNV